VGWGLFPRPIRDKESGIGCRTSSAAGVQHSLGVFGASGPLDRCRAHGATKDNLRQVLLPVIGLLRATWGVLHAH